ncbi:flavin reductase family protein [Paracidobacterium acidisoli]|uniref:Flavin reductase family protein n=1 Tax=Paracidobacterium acidisoli TaxID=2303751 RepID=A0A372IPA0_9BACT|nr:flavin reductase family protein [Paracidobacterium acidisoli]MBT9331002.1 flavin reductase family protein [Paracidobacterium acidisoli]
MHRTIEPAILYFGTPVVLISTLNEDGSPNLAPMSSAWWLGWRCLLGLGARSKTPQNLIRTGECVLNLPSAEIVAQVNRLARLTGSDPVPEHKIKMGYRHERDKFGVSGLTQQPSELVNPPRVLECPVQLEARLTHIHPLAEDEEPMKGRLLGLEVRIERVHIDDNLLLDGETNRIDPDKWRPLIMSFQHFYGLGPRLHDSTLAKIPESMYRAARPNPSVAEEVTAQ